MLEIAGKLLDASSHWPLTVQIALVVIILPLAIYAWRSGALNREPEASRHDDESPSESRRRIYNHIDHVCDGLEGRIRAAENLLVEYRVRIEHLEARRR